MRDLGSVAAALAVEGARRAWYAPDVTPGRTSVGKDPAGHPDTARVTSATTSALPLLSSVRVTGCF